MRTANFLRTLRELSSYRALSNLLISTVTNFNERKRPSCIVCVFPPFPVLFPHRAWKRQNDESILHIYLYVHGCFCLLKCNFESHLTGLTSAQEQVLPLKFYLEKEGRSCAPCIRDQNVNARKIFLAHTQRHATLCRRKETRKIWSAASARMISFPEDFPQFFLHNDYPTCIHMHTRVCICFLFENVHHFDMGKKASRYCQRMKERSALFNYPRAIAQLTLGSVKQQLFHGIIIECIRAYWLRTLVTFEWYAVLSWRFACN